MNNRQYPSEEDPTGNNSPSRSPRRALTVRAVLLALAVACLVAVLTNYHDGNVVQWAETSHNYVAPLVIALTFLFVLLFNAFLHRLHSRLSLRSGELAVALTLVLLTSPLPRFFAHSLVGVVGHTPALLADQHTTMRRLRKANPYKVLPDRAMLTLEESKEYDGHLGKEPGDPVSPAIIPWSNWAGPMLFWAPLLIVFLTFSVSFGYVIYRQWAKRELVPFPLAEFASSLIQKRDDRTLPDVFYKPAFWAGLLMMVVIYVLLGLQAHFEKMVFLPIRFSYVELDEKFTFIKFSANGYSLLRATLYFTIIAVAFILPTEISFTSWFTWPIMVTSTFVYYSQTGQRFNANDTGQVMMGAWWAMALLILYAGRWYYWGLLKAAFGLRSDVVDRQSIWIARVFLLSLVALVAVLCFYGLPLDTAVLWVLVLSILFLVVCRLVAEMGIPWTPVGAVGPLAQMANIIGKTAIGAKLYSLLSIFNDILLPQKMSLLLIAPAVTNAAHIESKITGRNPSLKIVGPFMLIMLLFCIGVLIWLGYSNQGKGDDLHSRNSFGISGVNNAANNLRGMIVQRAGGKTVSDEEMTRFIKEDIPFLQRWSSAWNKWLSPDFINRFLPFFFFGFVLVLVTGYLRLKLPRFPLHPLPLVLIGTWLMSRYWWSFFIGWLLKRIILKIGGGRLFERSRPFFTGIVIGQAVVCLIWVIANIIIYWCNGLSFDATWHVFMRHIYSG